MSYEGVPDRRIGLIVGIVGGLVGVYAMRRYTQTILPRLFPDADEPALVKGDDPLEKRALLGQHYQEGENVYLTSGRVAYTLFNQQAPQSAETRHLLGDLAQWGFGVLAGVAYGATRTSTLPRDIAGGFFYGIRLWLSDELLAPLLGLRAGPTRFNINQHFALLTVYWVYSFVTANVTRILYRIVAGNG